MALANALMRRGRMIGHEFLARWGQLLLTGTRGNAQDTRTISDFIAD